MNSFYEKKVRLCAVLIIFSVITACVGCKQKIEPIEKPDIPIDTPTETQDVVTPPISAVHSIKPADFNSDKVVLDGGKDYSIKNALINCGLSAKLVFDDNKLDDDLNEVYDVVLLAKDVSQNANVLKDFVRNGGILFVTSEADEFLAKQFNDIFVPCPIDDAMPIITNDIGFVVLIEKNIIDEIYLSKLAKGYKPNSKLEPIAEQDNAVICAVSNYGSGKIIAVPFDVDSASNSLLNYAIAIAGTANIEGRVSVAFSSNDEIVKTSYPLMLAPNTAKTYFIEKGQDDIHIAFEAYIEELGIDVYSPSGSRYILTPDDNMYSYMYRLSGESGIWQVKISNAYSGTLTVGLFVSEPINRIIFDNLNINEYGQIYTNKQILTLEGTNYAYKNFQLTIKNSNGAVQKTVEIVNNKFRYDVNLTPEKVNELEITATNNGGNVYTGILRVINNTIAPVITVYSSLEPAYLDEYSLIIGANTRCTLEVNGIPTTDISHGEPTYLFETILNKGINVFNIKATDLAGNTTTMTVSVTRSNNTAEGIDPDIIGFSIQENSTVTHDMYVYVFIDEDSDYTIMAWFGYKELDVDRDKNRIDLNIDGLPDGIHSLNCRVIDEWGNQTQSGISLYVKAD